MFSYDMFVSGYGVSSLDILWVQLVFGVWNVFNDLIGGYFSDWYNHKFGGRLELIIPFNILWCLATVIPYYELGIRPYSLHYLLYICLNDTFLSIQSIVTSAIWVDDLTKNENERIKLSLVTKPIGFVVGFTIIWFSYLLFDKDELDRFHILYWITFAISVFFTFASYFALKYLMKKYNSTKDKEVLLLEQEQEAEDDDDDDFDIDDDDDQQQNTTTFSMTIFFRDIIRQRNLWWFIIPSVINEFQGIFLGAYRPIFVDAFLNEFSDYTRSTYIAILSNGGVVIEIAILLASFKIGCAFFVRLGIYVRLITSIIGIIVLIIIYMTQFYFEWNIALAIFMMFWLFSFQIGFIFFLNFFNLIMASLVYEQRAYRIKNKLTELTSMTSMYWAIHAMFAKPFNGVGTIIGTFVIENAGYGDEANFVDLNPKTQQRVQYALFHLTAWFMFITSFIQWIFFRNYDLENEKLAKVEEIVNQHEENKKKKKKKRNKNKTSNNQQEEEEGLAQQQGTN